MNLINSVMQFLIGNKKKVEAPDGYCPNCWGRQEYSGEFYEAVLEEKIDLNNINKKKGWIQEYAAKHLEGIKLNRTHGIAECSACKLTYKTT